MALGTPYCPFAKGPELGCRREPEGGALGCRHCALSEGRVARGAWDLALVNASTTSVAM